MLMQGASSGPLHLDFHVGTVPAPSWAAQEVTQGCRTLSKAGKRHEVVVLWGGTIVCSLPGSTSDCSWPFLLSWKYLLSADPPGALLLLSSSGRLMSLNGLR